MTNGILIPSLSSKVHLHIYILFDTLVVTPSRDDYCLIFCSHYILNKYRVIISTNTIVLI